MMHAQILADALGNGAGGPAAAPAPDGMPMMPPPAGAMGLPSMSPASYLPILQQAKMQWDAEDAQIAEARHNALYQSILAACAPAAPAMPVPDAAAGLAGPDAAPVG